MYINWLYWKHWLVHRFRGGLIWPWFPSSLDYRLWLPSNDEINMRYWKIGYIKYIVAECLHPWSLGEGLNSHGNIILYTLLLLFIAWILEFASNSTAHSEKNGRPTSQNGSTRSADSYPTANGRDAENGVAKPTRTSILTRKGESTMVKLYLYLQLLFFRSRLARKMHRCLEIEYPPN